MSKKKSKAMASKGEKKPKTPLTGVQLMLEDLRHLYCHVSRREAVLQTQVLILECMDTNGASIASLAEKLNWSEQRLLDLLSPDCVDIDLRTVANVFTAMGHEFKVDFVPGKVVFTKGTV